MSDLRESIAKFLFLATLEAENYANHAVTDRDWDEFKLKHGDVEWWKKKAAALLREHRLVELDADQTWPVCINAATYAEKVAITEMGKAMETYGWRKVKEIAWLR